VANTLVLHQGAEMLGVAHREQVGVLGGRHCLRASIHTLRGLDQKALVERWGQSSERLLQSIHRGPEVLDLLFTAPGDRLPRRSDMLMLGLLIGCFGDRFAGVVARITFLESGQFLLDGDQRAPGLRHLPCLGREQGKATAAGAGPLVPTLGPTQRLRRAGKLVVLSPHGSQFLLHG
jgi:hypothetical protein